MLLRILSYAFFHLILTWCNKSYFNPHFRDEKTWYTAHKQLFQGQRADKMWLESRKFKPKRPAETNIKSLTSLHHVDRSSLTGAFLFQGIESGVWTVPCFGPKEEGPCALGGSHISHTPKINLLRDIWVLLSPGIWCSGLAQMPQDSKHARSG